MYSYRGASHRLNSTVDGASTENGLYKKGFQGMPSIFFYILSEKSRLF